MSAAQPMNPNPPRFSWRALTSVLITISFLVLLWSGIMLFASPPGRVANWTNWTLLGLTKKEWTNLHICFSALFLVVAVFHVVFNWRPLVGYFKSRLTRRISFRWEWVAALAVCGLIYGGTRAGIPPFSSLLAFNEDLKQSWEQPTGRAPIPHAELLTLAELAEKAEVELPLATSRLEAKGIQGASAAIIVEELAERNRRSAQEIYEIILDEPTRGRGAAGRGEGRGEGRGRGAQGAGGGPGRMTLGEFCRSEGIDVAEGLRRLEAKGMKGRAEMTLREIAVDNGYERPYEVLEILRGAPR